MKIGFYTSRVDCPDTGPGVYRENLARELLKLKGKDDEIRFIHFKDYDHEIYTDSTEILVPPAPLISRITRGLSRGNIDVDWAYNIGTEGYLKKNYDFDILHLQSVPYTRLFWMRNFDAKLVTTIHFAVRRSMNPKHYPWPKRNIRQYFFKKVSSHFDAVFTVSEYSKKLHAKYFDIDLDKIYVTYNAPPPGFEPTFNQDVINKYDISEPFIFHLSNKNYHKNPKGVIRGFQKAVEKYDIEHNLIIGGGSWTDTDVKRYSRGKIALDKIKTLDYIPREDLLPIYTHADFFYLPSFSEAFPFVIVESMACGTPILTIKGSGMPEIVGKAGEYIENPENHKEIGEKIDLISGNVENLEKHAKKRAKKFTWKKATEKTLDVYRKVFSE